MSTETWRERAHREAAERAELRRRLNAAETLEDRGQVMDDARRHTPHPALCVSPIDCYGHTSCPKTWACSE